MKSSGALAIGASCLVLAGCAGLSWEGKERRVLVEDNVEGRSAARVESTGDAVQVQVAQFADDCRLRRFLVGPRTARPEAGASGAYAVALRSPEVIEGGHASLNVYAPGDWVVRAQYVHTVLVDEGEKNEPDGQPQAWGAGDLQVGRPLAGGYTFDHVEFSSTSQGPGGASARVTRYPNQTSHDASITIHWYYDAYSKVRFQWKIYAQGPCDAKP
jgi:hypothetical protein